MSFYSGLPITSISDHPNRYVAELLKLKETFIEPLLHPFAASPLTSPNFGSVEEETYYASMYPRAETPSDSCDHLPIASRFTTPTPRPPSPEFSTTSHARSVRRNETPMIPPADGESFSDDDTYNVKGGKSERDRIRSKSAMSNTSGKPPVYAGRSPYGTNRGPAAPSSRMGTSSRTNLPFPSRSHQSLPPPPRKGPSASTTSLGRQSFLETDKDRDREKMMALGQDRSSTTTPNTAARLARKLRKPGGGPGLSGLVEGDGVPPHMLPEDLRKCLEVLDGGVLKGHLTLCEGLKKRYDEQYPLVRSLADVFIKNVSRGFASFESALI